MVRCPGYLEGGVPALANPCLYICENSSQIALQYACRQLGLPVSCIRLVPSSTSFGKCQPVFSLQISSFQIRSKIRFLFSTMLDFDTHSITVIDAITIFSEN